MYNIQKIEIEGRRFKMKCKKCRKELEQGYVACPFCGTAINNSTNATPVNNATNNQNSGSQNGGAIGLLIAIAGIVCVIFTLWFLVRMGNSSVADAYSFGTSFVTIALFIGIILVGVLIFFTGLEVMADGIAPHIIKVVGVAIMAVGIVAFYAKAFILGLVMLMVGIGIWKIKQQ